MPNGRDTASSSRHDPSWGNGFPHYFSLSWLDPFQIEQDRGKAHRQRIGGDDIDKLPISQGAMRIHAPDPIYRPGEREGMPL
jgi:hypothetical protein